MIANSLITADARSASGNSPGAGRACQLMAGREAIAATEQCWGASADVLGLALEPEGRARKASRLRDVAA